MTEHQKKELKAREAKAKKAHYDAMANRLNPSNKLDKVFQEASGVSPIQNRHPIDLYGTKIGLGLHNPIMVENINKLPEPEEFEDPAVLLKL